MAAWIVCALCALVIIKPQEFIGALEGQPLLYVVFGLALVGVALDVTWRRLRLSLAPQVPWVLAFLAWAALTTAVRSPETLSERGTALAITGIIFLTVAVGAGSARGLWRLGATLVGCAALISTVAILQAFEPYVCMAPEDPEDWDGKGELSPDGRPCETDLQCLQTAPDPQIRYRCERTGPLNTSTLRDRVRYRGSLADPNETSLMICTALPLAFALADRGRRRRGPAPRPGARPPSPRSSGGAGAIVRGLSVAAMVIAAGVVVVLSRSRTGLIVYLVVLGLHLVRRIGAWAIVAGCLIGPPMILLGGRSGADADASSEERLELVLEGFEMIKGTRGSGIGVGQFVNESSLGMTAHNAYLLAAAETGLVGVCLFGVALYASLKVPLAIWFADRDTGDVAARFAPAIFMSLCGALVGIFFLSWAYKDVLYIALGTSAALHAAVRAEGGGLRVRVSPREIALVCAGMIALLAALVGVVRLRL